MWKPQSILSRKPWHTGLHAPCFSPALEMIWTRPILSFCHSDLLCLPLYWDRNILNVFSCILRKTTLFEMYPMFPKFNKTIADRHQQHGIKIYCGCQQKSFLKCNLNICQDGKICSQQDGSGGKGVGQAWQPEFASRSHRVDWETWLSQLGFTSMSHSFYSIAFRPISSQERMKMMERKTSYAYKHYKYNTIWGLLNYDI